MFVAVQCYRSYLDRFLNWIVIGLVPPGGAPYNGLYGEATPKGGTFIRPQVYEGVAVSRVEERLGMSVIEIFQRT